jgi:hypothetical protein
LPFALGSIAPALDDDPPLIDFQCVAKPLPAALAEIRDLSGVNVLLDVRVAETARNPVTVTLRQVRPDTAARLLADMAGLRAVTVANVVYVTSIPNAKRFEALQQAQTAERRPVAPALQALGEIQRPPGLVDNSNPPSPPGLLSPPATAMPVVHQPRLYGVDEAGRQEAIAAGLDWLARHQAADGHWGLHDFHIHGSCNCTLFGGNHNVAGTCFALLPLVGAGKNESYEASVARGLRWLITRQGADGAFSGNGYEHALATLVVCQAYRASGDDKLKGPAQRAINCCVSWQHAAGGFRYTPRTPGDMSVTGWFIQALHAGRGAGLTIPNTTWIAAGNYIDSVANPEGTGFGYQQGQIAPTPTAAGVLCRRYLPFDELPDASLQRAKQYLNKLSPSPNFRNLYFYYYATKVVNLSETGSAAWNAKLLTLLIEQQDWANDPSHPHQKGSWSCEGDAWGGQLGRLGATSFALLALQAAGPEILPPPKADDE